MTRDNIEPLDPHTWFARLAKLLRDATLTEPGFQDKVIRQAYHLIKLAPGPLRVSLPADFDEQRVESMLECDAFESAVMVLVGLETSFTVQKDAGVNEMSVVVSLEAGSAPGHGRHESGAMAMIQAWARCLANTAGVALSEGVRNPSRRKSRPGPPPSSTAH